MVKNKQRGVKFSEFAEWGRMEEELELRGND
jgi:hypothetical protein